MWALVPIKQFELAKGRLASVLSAQQRQQLMRAMATDVLQALADCAEVAQVLVLSSDPEARALASAVGAQSLADPERGLNAALSHGADYARDQGAEGIVVVHGDLPLASSAAFTELLQAHGRAPAMTLVADAAGTGSNCMACSPPHVVPFLFGPDSAERHLQAARTCGVEPLLLHIPELALDIDSPADLARLEHAHGGRALALLRSSGIASGIASLPAAAHCC